MHSVHSMVQPTFEPVERSEKELHARAVLQRERRQLTRLERIIDVVFALVVFRSVTVLPAPTREEVRQAGSLLRVLAQDGTSFMLVLLGVRLIIVY